MAVLAAGGPLIEPALAGGAPARPQPGEGSSFYVHAGPERVAFDLDPRGYQELVAAGLDPRVDGTAAMLGVGWIFARPLRLDLTVGGLAGEVDRAGVDCGLARAVADLHLALAESRHASLEATVSLGGLAVVYTGDMDGESILGGMAGLGLTGRVALAGPVSLEAGYRWEQTLFARTALKLGGGAGGGDDDDEVAVHATGRSHGVRVMVRVDL